MGIFICIVLSVLTPRTGQAQPATLPDPEKASTGPVFALAPVLAEVGESRTRQWLASVKIQCSASKAKTIEGLCRALPSLPNETLAWSEITQRLDQLFALKCGARGLMTAYYEPVLKGSLVRESDQQVALYAAPEAAVKAAQAKQPWFSRGEIENLTADTQSDLISKLAPGLTPIAWIDDPVEAFFLHIQGSGRIQLRDQVGSPLLRVGFAGHNGHSYRAIGSTLVAQGEMQRAEVSANSIKAWLSQRLSGSNTERSQAIEVMRSNPRYVFFKRMPAATVEMASGPVGALAVPLTDMASVAADPSYHPLGTGLLIFTERLGAQLVQVQDVGGGIKGAGRLDLFTGTGDAAGTLASDFKEMLRSLEIVPGSSQDNMQARLQLDVATALANCSGGM
jgi:membrane-bound lytic murein transglycosylase A